MVVLRFEIIGRQDAVDFENSFYRFFGACQGLAPRFSSHATMSSFKLFALSRLRSARAAASGVMPSQPIQFRFAPCSRRHAAVSRCPPRHACQNALVVSSGDGGVVALKDS